LFEFESARDFFYPPMKRSVFWPTCLSFLFLLRTTAPAQQNKPLAAVLEPFVARQELAGAVMLVASKERILDIETVGYTEIHGLKLMPPDALFWIASQSKPMTAAALMMLVDEGKVHVEDPVEKYLPEFKGQMVAVERDAQHMLLRKPAHPITVREILSHTSGLPFKSPMEEPTLDQLRLRDAVRSYAMCPLEFEPGSKYQYSNAGLNTAGRIIEVVSGVPYEVFMEQRLLKPLGMVDTTFWPSANQLKRLAVSYKPGPNNSDLEPTTITQLQYPLSDRRRQPMPAGGLFSTARDVALFCRMILKGGMLDGRRYLSESAVRMMINKQTGDAVKEGYGFGWSTSGSTFGHGGAYSTNMEIDSRKGLVTVWMVQHAGFPGNGSQALSQFRQTAYQAFASEAGKKP
jgi:CubicO group peptidase (beta-lactamase class C family)